MKIEEAILIHRTWKTRVGDYIYNPDKSLRPEECHERSCALTKWMASEAAHELLDERELYELQKAHKAFHHTLSEIIMNANRGVEISEEIALGVDSLFNRHHEAVLRILQKIKAKKEKIAA